MGTFNQYQINHEKAWIRKMYRLYGGPNTTFTQNTQDFLNKKMAWLRTAGYATKIGKNGKTVTFEMIVPEPAPQQGGTK